MNKKFHKVYSNYKYLSSKYIYIYIPGYIYYIYIYIYIYPRIFKHHQEVLAMPL